MSFVEIRKMDPTWVRNKLRRILIPFVSLFAALSLNPIFAESVRILPTEEDAYRTRIEVIEGAAHSIDLSYYQIRDDDTVGAILARLVDAANRGVRIRIIVDAHPRCNNLPKGLVQYLICHGVEIRERPFDARNKLELGRMRLHDKLMVVDQSILFVGGRNLEEGYFGIGCEQYTDLEAVLRGCIAQQAADYFQQRWNECVTQTPRLYGSDKEKSLRRQVHLDWNQNDRVRIFFEVSEWLDQCRDREGLSRNRSESENRIYPELDDIRVELVGDTVGKGKKGIGNITDRLHHALDNARSSILISTPYCVPTREMRSILTAAAKRGVTISILTNSLNTTDQVLAQAGYANERRWMLRSGIRLVEYNGSQVLHTKLVIIDGVTAFIGSHNLDNLSERQNSEFGVLIHSVPIAQYLIEEFHQLCKYSNQIQRSGLFRREAKDERVEKDVLRTYQRGRLAAPFIQRYL